MKNPMKPKKEREYLKACQNYPETLYFAHEDSVQEGFEYFFETEFKREDGKNERLPMGMSVRGILKKIFAMLPIMKSMFKGRDECITDLDIYFKELSKSGKIQSKSNLIKSYPNVSLWNELKEYINKTWSDVIIGFTELPSQLIFKDKAVLFKYALIVAQEMQKDSIDQAPKMGAGKEVMRVYASLGVIVNEIARWLRKKGINCQSNHPVGGLVCTPPLAGKAGLGWQGRSGMLITPEFGPRQRTAPIFLQEKIFEYTDNEDHWWIEKYCVSCGLCERNCPAEAIHSEKHITISGIEGIGAMRTCIDREKCFPYFNETVGCSVCIKVCPFSNGPDMYNKLKQKISR